MNKAVMSAALMAAVASASGNIQAGEYLSGDFHNHTTCSDGSTSIKTLTRKSLAHLDWFIQVGHSGSGSRDCRVSDFLYLNRGSEFNRGLWINTLPNGAYDIKGDPVMERMNSETEVNRMWRWQSLQEFSLPSIVEQREEVDKDAFLGLEWVVPGHEHASSTIASGQYDTIPNADALAQFEYCFARNSDDTSQGGGQDWTCELSDDGNEKIIALFYNRPEEGNADYNSTLVNGINIEDAGDHVKSTAGVLWMQENFAGNAFSVQSHVERQGSFIPEDDEGYNVEHMRDWNSIAPDVAFGFESQPGHQASGSRGSYNAGRPTAGLFTYGGTGCYAGAESALPGHDFDGRELTQADFVDGNQYGMIDDDENPAKVTLCRPGVRTMWDAMLSEGRRFWFFASSDWHNRGSFGPLDYETTGDFWPGEYQENFVWIENGTNPAREIVDGLRSGNSYAVQGQLIDKLEYKACVDGRCATMGQTLEVRKGQRVKVYLSLRDPQGQNRSPYKFNNPSLLQIGKKVPVNEPELEQVDLIMGAVSDTMLSPDSPEYYNPLAPKSTHIARSWTNAEWRTHQNLDTGEATGDIKMTYSFRAYGDSYLRTRGSNIPAGTPNERDEDGNPLADNLSDNIFCEDVACPSHIDGKLDNDLEAWSDIWFYTNPIFIKIK